MSRIQPRPLWQNAVIILSSIVVAVVIVLTMQWGRPVLIPIAIAMLLTVLLSPAVKRLQTWGMNRICAVLFCVCLLGGLLLGSGGMMATQVTNLLSELPRNTETIRAKIKSLKELGSGPVSQQFGHMLEELQQEWKPSSIDAGERVTDAEPAQTGSPPTASEGNAAEPATVPWMLITGYLGSALEVVGALAFTMVLLVFFLLEREDLRDRVILLAGKARLSVTSKAIEDMTNRVTRYLVMVGAVNGGFGVCLTVGLFLLGMPYAILWGVLAGGLRFVPYIGPWVGAVFPIAMSLAVSNGWWQPLAVLGYVLFLELICTNVVEPLLYGRTTGVSPTALLILAVFWLFLWGPIGLVLSAPFAVCLVVIGKYIPQLSFLHLLLGDQPALDSDVSFYQRLMLGDLHAAQQIAVKRLQSSTLLEVCDELLVPTLNYADRDLYRNHLSAEDHAELLAGVRATLKQLDEVRSQTTVAPGAVEEVLRDPLGPESRRRLTLLGCPADDDTDCLGLELLSRLLDPELWDLQFVALETLTSEVLERVNQENPDLVCIASIPPGGRRQARYFCKRLRAVAHSIPLLVGRWGAKRISQAERDRLKQVGVTLVATSLEETCQFLASQWPLLSNRESQSRSPVSMTRDGARIP